MDKTEFNRYQIRREIGRGGMATVYLAYDPQFKRHVALKVLPAELNKDPQFRGRFEREAHTIAKLEHPAIVPVYDFGQQDGQMFLVMRLMNSSLADRIEHGPVDPADTLRILRPIASALDKAHAQGIIHRDLKPANILFDTDGNAYLSDFGIVKLAESTSSYTITGGIVGTPAYMSPEQAEGLADIDHRSDLYALAAILYEMLAGVIPYRADTPIGVALKHITQPVPRIREYNANISEAYQNVIETGMAKQRERRYPSATAMMDALQAVITAEGTQGQEATMVLKDVSGDTFIVADAPVTRPATQAGDRAPGAVPARDSAESPAPAAPRRRFPGWLWGVLALVLIGGSIGAYLALSGRGGTTPPDDETRLTVPDADLASPVVAAASATATTEPTASPEPTPTPTAEPTATPTPEPTPTPTPVTRRSFALPTGLETEMVLVPAGTFNLGDARGSEDEQPVREIFLSAFWIDRTEVTNAQFVACIDAGVCEPHNEKSSTRESYLNDAAFADYPVIYVSWFDAQAYCEWTGRRLPTEAEWEKAAKGTSDMQYPWGATFEAANLNYCDQNCPLPDHDTEGNDGFADTSPVGSFEAGASPYGAYDMAGNVWEWVADWYSETWYAEAPDSDPQGPADGVERVRRGHSWDTFGPRTGQVSDRGVSAPERQRVSTGFRCASDP